MAEELNIGSYKLSLPISFKKSRWGRTDQWCFLIICIGFPILESLVQKTEPDLYEDKHVVCTLLERLSIQCKLFWLWLDATYTSYLSFSFWTRQLWTRECPFHSCSKPFFFFPEDMLKHGNQIPFCLLLLALDLTHCFTFILLNLQMFAQETILLIFW